MSGPLIALLISITTPALTARAAFASEPEACPAPHRFAELRVMNLLGSSPWPDWVDMGKASAADVQLLTNARDRELCDTLWAAMRENGTDLRPGDQVTFYRSGDRYLVPIKRLPRRPLPPGTTQLGGDSTLDIYDSEYRLIGRFRA